MNRSFRYSASDSREASHLGPLLAVRMVKEVLGLASIERVEELAAEKRLLSLATDEGALFPAFQFEGRQVLSGIFECRSLLESGGLSDLATAAWFRDPNDHLQGQTPAEWLRSGGPVYSAIEAAGAAHQRLKMR